MRSAEAIRNGGKGDGESCRVKDRFGRAESARAGRSGRALVDAFLTNERINQVLLEILSPEVWRAQPPCVKRRNIATTFAHMHNVRCMRLKMSASDDELPPKLERG